MPSIVFHPDNWQAVKAEIDRGQFDKPGSMFAVGEVANDGDL